MTQAADKLEFRSEYGHAPLVLASSSRHRRALLGRLLVPFVCESSEIDETPEPDETPRMMVERLAIQKALAVAPQYPNRLIIGSDQVCVIQGRVLGKPGTTETAIEQLTAASGRTVSFLTSICVMASGSGQRFVEVVPCDVHFRTLSRQQITSYVHAERPLDCAGSFKSEGLGISLFESMHCADPSALAGLPLISLVRLLAKHGYDIFETLSEGRQPGP